MRLRRRAVAIGIAAVAILVGLAATSVNAFAKDGGAGHEREGNLFSSTVIGRPADANVSIRGVPAGGVPWEVSGGKTRVTAKGRLTLEVEGLLIIGTGTALDGTPGPVKSVVAALSCDGTTPTVVSSAAVPLDAHGDAKVDQRITLPAECLAPIVLVRANGAGGPWIAASGF
jgi:hypothetical protein